MQGRLVHWDAAKGYGFVAPDGGGAKLFVHHHAFKLRAARPRVGDAVSFEIERDAQGKPRAGQVRVLAPQAPPAPANSAKAGASASHLWLIPGFAMLVLICHLLWRLPNALWGAYMAMSMATFIVYAGDKRAAARGQWRVAETSLHVLALACGWPGALLAQNLLRHKTAKPSFLRRFWLMAALNVLGLLLLFTPLGPWLLALPPRWSQG